MIAFFTTLLRLFLQAFRSQRNILTENALLKKENEILLRRMGKKRAHFVGCEAEQGELLKLDILLSTKTIRKSFRISGGEGRSGSRSLGRSFWKHRYSTSMQWTS